MRFKVITSIFLLFLHMQLAEHYNLKGKQRSPVVFIPGDGGSQVEAKLNKTSVVHYICEKTSSGFFNIWLNLELLVPVVIDCWFLARKPTGVSIQEAIHDPLNELELAFLQIDNMKLVYDNVTRTTRNQEGVEIRIPGWGDPFVVEYLDPSKASPGSYFKDIGNMLVNDLGYIRNLSLRGAPYDFRKGPNESQEFFVKLKSLIEETFIMNNNAPVTLIAHSMGGPMSLIFLQRQTQKWKDKYINSLITLAGVWGGSVKALKVFAIGDDLGAYILRQSVLKDEQITSPSLGWLLPSRLFWKDNEVLVQTEQKNYTLLNLKQFFIDINIPNGWEFRKDNEKFQLNFTAPGTELHCLHGVKIDTVERLYYKPGTSIDGYPQLIPGDGDGTVNLRSLEGCLHWQGKQKQKIYHKGFPGVDHMNILKNASVLDYIRNVLRITTAI